MSATATNVRQMKKLIEEDDLNFMYFHCCGDEDLYPFGCPECQKIMVFCYECDTLYEDLDDLKKQGTEINNFKPQLPIFSCPGCGYEFEYSFMKKQRYKVDTKKWLESGYVDLLNKESNA